MEETDRETEVMRKEENTEAKPKRHENNITFSVSERTLQMMDSSVRNLLKGNVSDSVDVSEFD
ncbi:MAG: hypothetical protein IJ091_09550 [Oscillospiraceae bacterium]|nr:hypothetical protein [Oscillospiraceae bacterium]